MRVPAAPHPCQHVALSALWIPAVLTGVEWDLVLLCIFLMTYDVEHLFMCLFAIRMSSSVRCLLRSLAHFLIYLFYLFIYLFLAVLGLRFCVRAFSSCGERGLLFIAVRRLLIVEASLCCGAWALGTPASAVVARRL